MPATVSAEIRAEFGEIDIYLFDQLLRGRFDHRRRVLDAGCGAGRNLVFFLRHGFDVYAVDADAGAIRAVRQLVAALNLAIPPDRIRHAPLESLPWEDGSMDVVISSAVLHFARDEREVGAMLQEMWRVLAPGGLFFARLATSIGLERHLPATTGRMRLPDGSERFVTDERTLLNWTSTLGGTLADPLKTTNVQNIDLPRRRNRCRFVLEPVARPDFDNADLGGPSHASEAPPRIGQQRGVAPPR